VPRRPTSAPFPYTTLFRSGPTAQYKWMTHWDKVDADSVAKAVKEIGADYLVLSTDLGQQGMMTPPDGVENQIAAVKAAGVSDEEDRKSTRLNSSHVKISYA